jgi:hypothetical protein
MLTDDPDTPGRGRCEINTAYTEQRTKSERVRSLPHVDVNYGLGESIQLKYETGWVYAKSANAGAPSGLDDSLIGLKWRFLDQAEAGLNMSMYPQLEVENSTGSVARGIANPAPNLLLPFEISRDLGRLRLVGELGYRFLRSDENEWVYGILGSLLVSHDLEFMAEARTSGHKLLSHGDLVFNLGLRKGLGSRLTLLASVGTGLNNWPASPSFVAYLGIQLVLGKERP